MAASCSSSASGALSFLEDWGGHPALLLLLVSLNLNIRVYPLLELERPTLWKANLPWGTVFFLLMVRSPFPIIQSIPVTIEQTITLRKNRCQRRQCCFSSKITWDICDQSSSTARRTNIMLVFGNTYLPTFCWIPGDPLANACLLQSEGLAPYLCLELILFLPIVKHLGPTCPEGRWCNGGKHYTCAWR